MDELEKAILWERGFFLDSNPHLKSKVLQPICDSIIESIICDYSKKPKSKHVAELRHTVIVLVTNLYRCYATKHHRPVKIPAANALIEVELSRVFVEKVLNYLKKNKLIYFKAGFHNRLSPGQNLARRAYPTNLLIDKFREFNHRIILSDLRNGENRTLIRLISVEKVNRKKHKERIVISSYLTREPCKSWVENLININNYLEKHYINIYLSQQDIMHIEEDRKVYIDVDRCFIYRSFNLPINRKRPIFEYGGRFYGGWWIGVPKEYRRYILIDDSPTIELDYSAYHISMLYSRSGKTIPNGNDIYKLDGFPFDDGYRDEIKSLTNAMINSTSKRINPKEYPLLRKYAGNLKIVKNAILAKHAPIEDKFYSGIGSILQFTDSEIAESVMLEAIKLDIPILPIHDSFIVKQENEAQLEQIMTKAARDKLGIDIRVKRANEPINPIRDAARQREEYQTNPNPSNDYETYYILKEEWLKNKAP